MLSSPTLMGRWALQTKYNRREQSVVPGHFVDCLIDFIADSFFSSARVRFFLSRFRCSKLTSLAVDASHRLMQKYAFPLRDLFPAATMVIITSDTPCMWTSQGQMVGITSLHTL